MKRHHRNCTVQEAETEIRQSLVSYQQKHNLTDVEFLHILTTVQQSTLKYMLRDERHLDQRME